MPEPLGQRNMTAEDLYGLPEDGRHHELLRGSLVSEPLPGGLHGRTVTRLAELLGSYARAKRLGGVYTGDTGFVLARRPDTVRGPDLAFISEDRRRGLEDERRFIPGAPDLAVEVTSPSDRTGEVMGKVADYLAAGTRIVWLVNPAREQVSVFRSPFAPRVLSGSDVLEGEEILPGFTVAVSEIFEP